MLMIDTMRRNFEGCTKQEVEDAIAVRHLQGMLGNPRDKNFLAMAHARIIPNFAFTIYIANVSLKSDRKNV